MENKQYEQLEVSAFEMGVKHVKNLMIAGIFSVLLLSGCGGGSGGVVAPTTRAIVTNNLRIFVSGDNIQYSMTGSVTTGAVNTPLTGTATYSITTNSSPLDPTGIARSVNTIALTGTFSNGTPFASNGMTYYGQDATGNYNVYGDSTSLWITSPISGFVTGIKSPIASPSSWINSYTQQNGDVTTDTITVIGKSTVTTGMGTFETYKIQTDSTITLAAGGTDVSTEIDYVVPSIGPIKITINLQSTDALGVVTTSQFALVASTTNIAF